MNDFATLRRTMADLADRSETTEHPGSAYLYERTLNTSRRLARRRYATAVAAAVLLVAAVAVPAVVLHARDHAAPTPTAPSPSPSPSPTPSLRPPSTLLAGQLPAPDADVSAAPYYVTINTDGSMAEVYDAATGFNLGGVSAPDEIVDGVRYTTFFSRIAAAGDDRTFVLCAIENTNSESAQPVWMFEMRLGSDGRPGPLRPLRTPSVQMGTVGHYFQGIGSIAITADGSELAVVTDRIYADNNGPPDIAVISLVTGQVRRWTTRTPVYAESLSWAGDHTLAYLCDGVCVLDTAARGTTLPAHPLIPWKTEYAGLGSFEGPVLSPDGSSIYVSMSSGPGYQALVRFSTATGKPMQVVIPPQQNDGGECSVLWSDPSGRHMTAECSWGLLNGTIDDGAFHATATLSPPDVGIAEGGGDLVAW